MTLDSADNLSPALDFVGFPSIEGFHNVVKSAASFLAVEPAVEWPYQAYVGPLARGTANYRGKIKLHGTNAGIRLSRGRFAAQSRSQIITPTADNSGFARWVESQADYWKGVSENDVTVFGEFCGPGIMKGTAINKIHSKILAIFAVLKDGNLISEPSEIETLLPNPPADVHVLPWHGEAFMVDFNDRVALQAVADTLNGVVAAVEPADPWVKATFGVDGTGEGVVYYPGAGEPHSVKFFSDFAFKAKGEMHKVTRTKDAVQVDPEIAADIDEFVSLFVTEARLEQGLVAVGGSTQMKYVGPFLKWMSQDVNKESADEREAAQLTWEQVQKAVQTASRNWFVARNKSI